MPYDTDCNNSESDANAIAYRERLSPWVITRLLPNTQQTVIARFRTRADAEGRLRHLRQQIPNASFTVVFDCQRDTEPETTPPLTGEDVVA